MFSLSHRRPFILSLSLSLTHTHTPEEVGGVPMVGGEGSGGEFELVTGDSGGVGGEGATILFAVIEATGLD